MGSNANCLCHILGAIKERWFAKSYEQDCAKRASGSFDGLAAAPSQESQERLLTDFCGSYSDVVPHVRLAVQGFGQCDLPVLHVNVELPL